MTDDEIHPPSAVGAGVGLVRHHDYVTDTPFEFELGGHIPRLTLRYETYGHLNADRSNAILVCHALTGDHHAAGRHREDDRKPGWWDAFIGPGRPLDTSRWFVIGVNCVGGCAGSSGPSSVNPATGLPYALAFPQVTMRDMVRAQHLLVRSLGIRRLHAVLGGSMGGMQGLLWAIDYPDEVDRVVALACAARQHAQAIAFNEVGRQAIMGDAAWRQGNYYAAGKDGAPKAGLAAARMLGHITYLSVAGMERRFGRTRCAEQSNAPFAAEFEVERYLRHQGETFVNRFDANSYLYITKATDRFDLAAGNADLASAFAPVKATVSVIGFSSDWLYPPPLNRAIHDALLRAGKTSHYAEIESEKGHDSFLIPSEDLFAAMRQALGNEQTN